MFVKINYENCIKLYLSKLTVTIVLNYDHLNFKSSKIK